MCLYISPSPLLTASTTRQCRTLNGPEPGDGDPFFVGGPPAVRYSELW
jgi:hypothetical protein